MEFWHVFVFMFVFMVDFVKFHESSPVTNCSRLETHQNRCCFGTLCWYSVFMVLEDGYEHQPISLCFNYTTARNSERLNYHKENIRKLTFWTAPGSLVFH